MHCHSVERQKGAYREVTVCCNDILDGECDMGGRSNGGKGAQADGVKILSSMRMHKEAGWKSLVGRRGVTSQTLAKAYRTGHAGG